MGNNRKLRSSGNIEIVSNATTVSGTLGVTGQSTLSGIAYPTSDGNADQVLVTNGSGTLSFADASSGLNVVTLSNQTEATAYSPQENDFVKITGDVTLTSKTLVNVDFVLDSQTRTLTIDQGSADGCSFLGGVVIVKAGSSYSHQTIIQSSGFETISITDCRFNCHKVDILQELVSTQGLVNTTVKDTFINCSEYRYYVTYENMYDEGDGGGDSTRSTFDNVQIIALTEGTSVASGKDRATADFTDVLVTSVITLPLNRVVATGGVYGDPVGDTEDGSKTNCKQITLTNA